jgi:beta-glucanase (GH16 family)
MRPQTDGGADRAGDAFGRPTARSVLSRTRALRAGASRAARRETGRYRGLGRAIRIPARGSIPALTLIIAGVITITIGLTGVFLETPAPAAAPGLPSPDRSDPAAVSPSDMPSPGAAPSAPQASGHPSASAAPTPTRSTTSPVGHLVWSDEFNGPAGSGPDSGKWVHDTGGGGFGNNELEYHTTSTRNAGLDGNGHLVITARKENPAGYACWYGPCQYTSGRLNTSGRLSVQYGHLQAAIQLPRGPGIWPAFWALGTNVGTVGWPRCGEIDIMENSGREPGRNRGSLHGPGYSGGNAITGTYSLGSGQAFADGFHVFAVDWSPNLVRFSVDGDVYESRTPADTNDAAWVFNHPFFLVLDVAVGGFFAGPPDTSSTYPQRMVVDYVRVYA